MRGMLSRARLLAVALATVAVAAVAVASASATTATTTAGGLAVTASLSPDTVSKSQTVTQTASVTNVSTSVEDVRVRIIGPVASPTPSTFFVVLQPSATFTKSTSFPASLLKPGSDTLTVIALNIKTNATAQATASVAVN